MGVLTWALVGYNDHQRYALYSILLEDENRYQSYKVSTIIRNIAKFNNPQTCDKLSMLHGKKRIICEC